MNAARPLSTLCTLLAVLAPDSPAQSANRGTRMDEYAPYTSAVPAPESVLGYAIGSQHTMYHQQQAVIDAMVAAAPDRVRTEVIGRTAEGKVMRLLIISSPANILRLDEIRRTSGELADPRNGGAADVPTVSARQPVIVMLSHSVHGNEPAGFEAAMMTTYTLLASTNPQVRAILDSTVVIINPSQNPDGHERFAAWSNSVAVGSDEPSAVEQDEPWAIQGRFNHFRFDMNRDLIAFTQAETRATAGAVLRWRPQVFVDLHSTTPQYFFPPAASPVNRNLPARTAAWLEVFGRANAAAFDRHGWQYFVRDAYDLYYPGYWDSWTSLNGAIGMTFESDGGPELAIRKSDGTVTTFRDGIAHHFVASMATLAAASSRRAPLLADFHDFFASAMTPTRSVRRIVIAPGSDPARTALFVATMRMQRIEVQELTRPLTVAAANDYLSGVRSRRVFPVGSYVVDLAQPQGRLAGALLEPSHVLDSVFARRQLDRYERNRRRGSDAQREGYEFYDITAWSLPLTYGLDAAWTDNAESLGGELRDVALAGGPRPAERATSAYVIPAGNRSASVMALALLRDGVNVASTNEPLRAGGASYPVGTFVVRVARNADGLHEKVVSAQALSGADVYAVNSAFPDSGQIGVGSTAVEAVHPPRVLVMAGDGVSQTGYGDVWWYLERELQQPFVPVDPRRFGSVTLERFNVVVLPPGNYAATLGTDGMNRLRDWVRGGGVVIALGSAVSTLEQKELGLRTPVDAPKSDNRKLEATDTVISARDPVPFVSPSAAGNQEPEGTPGAIGRATLDRTHWLTWGYDRDKIAVPLPARYMRPSKNADNVVVFNDRDAVIAGFTWPGNTDRFLTGSVWATVESVGRGTVVAFAENPLFRGFWRGTARLFENALLHGAGRR
ncbi:MAG: M14 family zinc carboxypeptidase [Gemmatimonadales bacterium]